MTKPRKNQRQRAREEIGQLLKQSTEQAAKDAQDKMRAEMEALKAKHHSEISIMAQEIEDQRKALYKTYSEGTDKLKEHHKKELAEATAEIWRQVGKYEEEHIRLIDRTIDADVGKVTSNHFELLYKNHLRRSIENGFRRAQSDPNYAVIRELLHAGKDIEKVDFMAISKLHEEATVFGMTMIAEELGFKLNWDVKLRKAADESKPNIWKVAWKYADMVAHSAQAMDEVMAAVQKVATKDIESAEDKKL